MKKQVKIGLGAAALALAAALCAGGTLAGWRTSSTVTNHISTATVQGIVEEKYEQGQTITPGQTVEKVRLGEKYRHSQLPCAGQSGD